MNQKSDHISSRVSFSLPQTDPPETFPRNDSLPLRKWKNGDILLTGNWNGPLTKGNNNSSPCTVYIRKWIGGPVAILGKSSVRWVWALLGWIGLAGTPRVLTFPDLYLIHRGGWRFELVVFLEILC